MSIILVLSSDKVLSSKANIDNYKSENDFEYMTIYLPLVYNNNDILANTIQLNILNADNDGDVITLENPIVEKERYKYTLPIPVKWTYKSGKLTFWLKFLSDNNIVGLTNEVYIYISESKEIAEYIPEQSLSLLDEWTQEMNDISETTTATLEKMEDITAHPPHIGENGNWYIYDTTQKDYVNSEIKVELPFETRTKDDYWIIFGTNIE